MSGIANGGSYANGNSSGTGQKDVHLCAMFARPARFGHPA